MSNSNRLVGADATLYRGSVAANATTSGSQVAGAFYKVATISGTSVFPTGIEVGDIWLGDAAKSFSVGNSAYLITATEMMDINSFDMAFKADEIEVSVLADDVKKYRKGKTDMTGTIKGINIISEMQKSGSVLNRFLRTATATAANVISTVNALDNSELIGVFYLQKDATTSTETMTVLVAQCDLFGYNLGASLGDAQSFDSGLRFTGNDPIVYFRPNA